MPELPEVETIVRQLRAKNVEGKRIVSAAVLWAPTVAPLSVSDFCQAVEGTIVEQVSRVGKWIIFSLSSGQSLCVHLRMSGHFLLESSRFDRVILELNDGIILYYGDPRKFGRWKLVDDPAVILGKLGPDALTDAFDFNYFYAVLQGRKRKIKPFILDQSIVAGLGNIYADEALWAAKIHPERIANSLSKIEIEELYCSIRDVLEQGVKNRGTSLGVGKANYRDMDGAVGGNGVVVKAYGRSGLACERCGELLVKKKVAQRGSTFCPVCQIFDLNENH
jgi:formamidopyrimidine-DNA glycosylase